MRVSSRFIVLLFIVVSSVILSSSTLELIGVPYVRIGGNPAFKIHVYTYLLLIYFFYDIVFHKREVVKNINSYDLKFCMFAYGVGTALFILYGIIKYGVGGMAFAMDTLLSAWIVVVIIISLNQQQAKRILMITLLLLTVCSIIIIFEKFTLRYLIDSKTGYLNYFRPKGFFNHPLTAALVLASVLPLIFSVVQVSSFKGSIVVSLWIVAVLATGSRTASIIMLTLLFLSVVFIAIKNRPKITFGQCWVGKKTVKAVGLYSVAILLLGMVFALSGFADRVMNELDFDASAMARFGLIDLLSAANSEELLFGSKDFIENSLEYYTGINILENYFVAWILTYGLLVAVPLYASMIFFMYSIAKRAGFFPMVAVLIFIFVSLSNNSLVTKSPVLLIFVSMLTLTMVAYRKPHKMRTIGSMKYIVRS